jgi:hypothetical protein
MRTRLILGTLLVALAVPVAALSQEAPERGQLGEWVIWQVAPDAAGSFEAVVKKVVEAAELAALGEEHGWVLWQSGFMYGLYGSVEDMAQFDDPEAFMRAFQGTAGEAKLMEAMEEFGTLDFDVLSREVVEAPPDWRYMPENPYAEETPIARVYESWMKPGTEMKADEITKEWVAYLKEVGYGYEAFGLRVHFGDVSRLIYVTYIDNEANYFGANSLMKLVEEKGFSEKWGDLGERWNKLIRRYDETTWTHRADLSYLPSE